MGTHKQTIEIDAIIKTSLQNLDQTMNKLQGELKSGKLQLDLTKGVGKDLSKLISNFQTGFSKIKQMTPDDLLKISDSKEFQREGAAVVRTITEIQRIVGDLGTKNIVDAKKIFPNSFDTRVTELLNSITKVQSSFETLGQKQAALSKVEVDLQGLTAQLNELDQAAGNKQGLEKMATEANNALNQTKQKVEEVRGSLSKEIEIRISQENLIKTKQKVDELDQKLKQFTDQGVTSGKGGKGLFQGKGIGEWQKLTKSGNSEEKAQAAAAVKLLQDYNKINTALREQQKLLEDNKKLQELMEQSPKLEGDKALKTAGNILGQKDNVKKALEDQARAAERAAQAQQKLTQAENAGARRSELTRQITEKTQKMNELNVIIKGLESGTNLSELAAKFYEITNINVSPDKTGLTEMTKKLKELDATAYDELVKKLQELGIILPQTKGQVDNLGNGFDKAKDDVAQFNDKARELDQLKNRIKYFFGLTNSINLFKRAIRSALNTVKELDATMTEAAVVTDFSVGDMWDKLPTYSKEAQKLGVSINGMYQATTLYYQQGLKTNEAMALGVETMKMARIASMDSTEATTAMTAALRGFNMELNETSATRVNDVYSQLAAVTAADTNQIATAMKKTASIAASANMEFETTAALLAQIIETTQEAPETAGTAMKTIIARFSEVKSLRERGETTGKDEEGEAIDVNKIQTALRSVGISMEGFFAGTEGLDSILLKLAEKWGTLDVETQRYIATMAAGSRQQSRFLAMMSDYGRTMELVSEAKNSAGASQKQFEKTQDSLATSLTRLKNAYDEFLMGLANNEILKLGIDLLTKFIETVNKLTSAVSGGGGLAKSLMSLVTVVAGLKAGGLIFGGAMNKFAGKLGYEKKEDPNKGKTNQSELATLGGLGAGLKGGLQKDKEWLKKTGDRVFHPLKGVKERYYKEPEKAAPIFEQRNNLLSALRKQNGGLKGTEGYQKSFEVAKTINEKGMDAAIAKSKELGLTLDEQTEAQLRASAAIKQGGLDTQKLGSDMMKLGGAVMGAGTALSLLSGLFESMGLENAAETTQDISKWVMGIGIGLMTLGQIMPGITALTGAQAAATWAWLVPLLAIGVALAGILYLFVKAEKKKFAQSLEGRMKAAAEATERAKEAAEDAKTAYDSLMNSKTEYDELQTKLEEATEGTIEWKMALAEVNSQVLQLIQKYPMLFKYLQKGKFGELSFTEEGWEKVIEDQQKGIVATNSALLANQLEESRLRKEKAGTVLKEAALDNRIAYYARSNNNKDKIRAAFDYNNPDYIKTYDEETAKELYNLYKEDSTQLFLQKNGQYSDKLVALVEKAYGLEDLDKNGSLYQYYFEQGIENFKNMMPHFAEYDMAIAQEDAYIQTQTESLVSANTSEEILKTKEGQKIVSGVASAFAKDQAAKESEWEKKIYDKDNESEWETNAEFQKLAAQEGLTSKDFTGDDKHDLEVLYASMAGISVEDIADGLKGNKKKLSQEIAKIQAARETGQDVTKHYEAINKVDEKNRAAYLATFSKDVSGLRLSDSDVLDDLSALTGSENWETVAKEFGFEEGREEMFEFFGVETEDQMKQIITGLQTDLDKGFDAVKQEAEELKVENLLDSEFLEDATLEQYENYTNLMIEASGRLGTEGAKDFYNNFDGIMANATEEQREQILNMLSDFDFSQEGAAEQFLDFLKSIGIDMSKIPVEDFTKQLNGLQSIIQKIDVSKLREASKTLLDLADDLKERESTEGLSEEEYQQAVAGGVSKDDFVWTGQEWLYKKGSLGDLAKLLEGKALARNGSDVEDRLNEQIARGEEVNKIYEEDMDENERKAFDTGTMDIATVRDRFGLKEEDYTDAEVQIWLNDSILAKRNLGANRAELAEYQKNDLVTSAYYNLGEINWQQAAEGDINAATEAYFSSHQGLDIMAENFEKTTGTTNGRDQYKISEMGAKQLAIAVDKAHQAMKGLNEALQDNADDFKIGDKKSMQYCKALSRVTEAAEDVFGEGITEEFVHNNRELFEQLMAGGENAQKAYEQIAKNYGESMLKNYKEVGDKATEVTGIMNEAFDNAKIGEGMDLTPIYTKLRAITGMSHEAAMAILKDWGFEVTLDTTEVWMGPDGQIYTTPVQGGEKIQMVTGTKGNASSAFASSGGGGGGSKWENPYDEFYNTVAKINEELRTREKIELRYQRLLDRHAATAEKLAQLSRDQITSLETERADREYLLAGRERQMRDIETEYKDLDEYARYNEQTRQVEINWDLIEKLDGSSNEKLTSRIEEYISKLEEQEGMIEEEIDALDEIQDAVWEIYEQGKEDYLDLEDQIKEAIIGARQREIDKLSEINESINDTNSKLIDSMQKQIDQYRQNRENERTEEEISDKQRRLAYLQQDTSGANALEIMKLQEEIDRAQEDYTDTLIDQKISELQDQNDQAAEQRQHQIDIMQAQLDHDVDTGEIWTKVHSLMERDLSATEGLMSGSELSNLLMKAAGFEGMSHIQRMDWLKGLEATVANGLKWLANGALQSIYGQGAEVTFKDASGGEFSGTIDENGNVIADGQIWSGKNFYVTPEGEIKTTQTSEEAIRDYQNTLKPEEPENKPTKPDSGPKDDDEPEEEPNPWTFAPWNYSTNSGYSEQYFDKEAAEEAINAWAAKENAALTAEFQRVKGRLKFEVLEPKEKEKLQAKLVELQGKINNVALNKKLWLKDLEAHQFKTGGLADFTGPAWLDGTKSRPEYVLNADQTKSFFQLVDVLSSLRSGTSQTTQNSGDNTYDIDINVESIGSDYDVEQLANTVKRLINEDARYRNNNAINLMR